MKTFPSFRTGPNILFGVPDSALCVPGFDVVSCRDQFVLARQGGKEFYLEDQPRRFRLFPRELIPEPLPHAGEYRIRFDKAISIPKP